MKVNDFISTARKIANDTPTRYSLGGVGQHEGDTFLFDCVGLIKSILWGFDFDYSQYRGGAIYASNGVPDVDCDDFFNNYCYDKSNDMTNIEVGELVYMDGHIGIYNGNMTNIESTVAWKDKVQVTEMTRQGGRHVGDDYIYAWKWHGKCKFIEYNEKPTPTPKPVEELKVGDKVKIISEGRASSYGDLPIAYGIGWIRYIKKIYSDRPYPYQVGNDSGTTGFYKKEALKKV